MSSLNLSDHLPIILDIEDPLGPPHPLYPPLLSDVTEGLLSDVTEGNNQQRGLNTCLGG